jgi:hypothetical protein
MKTSTAISANTATTSPRMSQDNFNGKCLSLAPSYRGENNPHQARYIFKFTRDMRRVKPGSEKNDGFTN